MAGMDYLDFEIEIGLGSGRDYPVAVLHSPAGEARATMRFPFDQLALESRLKDLQIALLRSGGKRRLIATPEEQAVQAFGGALFEALFTGEIRSCYDVSIARTQQRDCGLRLKLRIQAPQLAALPWEFLYDSRHGEYACLSTHTPIVRYIELSQPPQVLQVAPPLRILGMACAPTNMPELDLAREKARVERAIANLVAQGAVSLTWLEGQTWRDLQRAMRGGPWHIFYFIGHGGFDAAADEGLVALAREDGRAYLLPATQLARLLADHRTLRLVVLNACEGARGSEQDIFSSTASILVRRGLPAVLAMQYEITDGAAIEFARSFYEALADGYPVDAAVSEARKGVSLEVCNSVEWGTPVLYMRTPDGILFDLAAPSAPAQPPIPAQPKPTTHAEPKVPPAERAPGPASTTAPSVSTRATLRQAMNERLSIDEVKTACFDLGVQAENLGGSTKGALVIGLIELLERRNRGVDLVAWLRGNRPDHVWPDPYAIPAEAQDRAEVVSQLKVQPEAPERAAPAPSRAVTADSLVIESPIHLELVRVPAGEFLMGSDGRKDSVAWDDEKPQHRVHLPEFLIGKVAVTVEQFATFVKATGHKTTAGEAGSGWVWQDGKWNEVKGANWQHPSGPDSDVRKKADHPVTQVSWHDAVAFCRWLSEATGRIFWLPTEAEWEKAARGTDGRLYPWGDEAPDERRCNFDNKVGDTTPVGKYPAGASPYGALDMAGNVWDWTSSLWGKAVDRPSFPYPYDLQDGREDLAAPDAVLRVLRGGAFLSHAWGVRCVFRLRGSPGLRDRDLGFRVVASPSHS